VISLQLYHAKLNGPVPWGLAAFIAPFWDPDVLQNIKMGSFTAGAEGYEVYRTAVAPGEVSWALQIAGNKTTIIKQK